MLEARVLDLQARKAAAVAVEDFVRITLEHGSGSERGVDGRCERDAGLYSCEQYPDEDESFCVISSSHRQA